MIAKLPHKIYSVSLFFILAVSAFLNGCKQPHEYKQQADDDTYNIIDSKWQDEFGPKANYRISDVNASPDDIQIPMEIPDSGVLTLQHAVSLATAYNREYQLQKELLYVTALDVTLFRHVFEKQFFGGAFSEYNSDELSETVNTEADFGFSQLLEDGTLVTTRLATGWLSVIGGNFDGGVSSILTASITKPLLRGSSRDIVMEDLTQAQRDALYQIRSFNRFRKQFVVSIITDYYTILQFYDALQNANENYQVLSDMYDKTQNLVKSGRIPLFELNEAEQDLYKAKDSMISAEKDYTQALDDFKILLGIPTYWDFEPDVTELRALVDAGIDLPIYSESEVLDTAFAERLDLANAADFIDDAKRKIIVAQDALRAEANLFAATSANTERTQDLRFSNNIDDEYNVALDLDLPLDRLFERNEYRKALIVLNQRQREYQLTADTVALDVRRAHRDFLEASQRYHVQLDSLNLARKRYKNTFMLLQYGRTDTRDVLDAQEDYYDAQNEATQSLIDFNIAVLNFYRDTEVLQVRPDGFWQVSKNQ